MECRQRVARPLPDAQRLLGRVGRERPDAYSGWRVRYGPYAPVRLARHQCRILAHLDRQYWGHPSTERSIDCDGSRSAHRHVVSPVSSFFDSACSPIAPPKHPTALEAKAATCQGFLGTTERDFRESAVSPRFEEFPQGLKFILLGFSVEAKAPTPPNNLLREKGNAS